MLSTFKGIVTVLLMTVVLVSCSVAEALHYPIMEEDEPLHFDDDSTLSEGNFSFFLSFLLLLRALVLDKRLMNK